MAVVKMGDIATIGSGQGAPQDPSDYSHKGNVFIRAGSLEEIIATNKVDKLERIEDKVAKVHKLVLYPKGTIIFAKSGMSATKNRIFEMPWPGYVVNHLATLIFSDDVYPAFMRYFWEYIKPSKLIVDQSYPSIRLSTIQEVKIDLPTLSEQKRIAGILAKADRLRRLRRYVQELGDTFLQSVFVEMFGDPIKNTKKLQTVPLESFISFMTSGSRGWTKYYSNNGDLFLRIQNVSNGYLLLDDVQLVSPPNNAESRRTIVTPGDLLLTITADLGRAAVIPEGFPTAYINQHIALLRLNNINPIFVSGYLSSPGGKSVINQLDKGGVKSGLNFEDIRNIEIFNPPKTEQEKFVTIFYKFERLKKKLKAARIHCDQLFQSLLHQAFWEEF